MRSSMPFSPRATRYTGRSWDDRVLRATRDRLETIGGPARRRLLQAATGEVERRADRGASGARSRVELQGLRRSPSQRPDGAPPPDAVRASRPVSHYGTGLVSAVP